MSCLMFSAREMVLSRITWGVFARDHGESPCRRLRESCGKSAAPTCPFIRPHMYKRVETGSEEVKDKMKVAWGWEVTNQARREGEGEKGQRERERERHAPGLRLHSSSHRRRGSMGMTPSTMYTLVPLVRASSSREEHGGMKWDTSAMCTPTRKLPEARGSMDRASSRSLAVGGSIEKTLHACKGSNNCACR